MLCDVDSSKSHTHTPSVRRRRPYGKHNHVCIMYGLAGESVYGWSVCAIAQ